MIMRSAVSLAALALALVSTPVAAQPAGSAQALGRNFDSMISSADQLAWLEQMSSEPNHVGSPHDKANAEFQLAMFKQWCWDAHIETFDVLYPTPISTTLELISPTRVTLGGQEPMVPEDPSSQHMAGALNRLRAQKKKQQKTQHPNTKKKQQQNPKNNIGGDEQVQ